LTKDCIYFPPFLCNEPRNSINLERKKNVILQNLVRTCNNLYNAK
jgi:hypothetical protein